MNAVLAQTQKLYLQPDSSAATDVELALGEEIEIGKDVNRNGVRFHQVRRKNGQTGYIPLSTRVSWVFGAVPQDADRRDALNDMRVGSFWCIAGGAAAAATLAAGGPVGVFGAALAFGVIRMCRGAGKLASSK